ncbi:Sedlin [Choiromyces venosus 120613-1]|uniref:Sedlin n=1 Tax=Choiromyces venosus 120613-1 TaxID=1336337 RepID=A0A3N4JKZ2_9PEZI|nr:Sedlin [Choiromyces venosus 120613-1]
MSTPRIACIALISRNNSPLHLHPFPSSPSPATLKYHFLTHATLDVFAARLPLKFNGDSDFGLLYSIDEELAAYGWLTNTGVKIVVIIDLGGGGGGGSAAGLGVKDGELKGVFRALQTAYIRLVCNPFYEEGGGGAGGVVRSRRFVEEVRRIGEGWAPGGGGGAGAGAVGERGVVG